MKKSKVFGLIMAMALVLSTLGLPAFAADASAKVTVTIINGSPVLVRQEVTVTDADEDGALTVNDALILAHDLKFEGGSAAGYKSSQSDYGLFLEKLWGVENGGSYGYYLNDTSCMSLGDAVADGDDLVAFVYTDTAAYSDTYSYFDLKYVPANAGSEFTLTLKYSGYDTNWSPVVAPVAGAVITVDGVDTSCVTDAEGKVTLKLDEAGSYLISAHSADMNLVPPVCVAEIAVAPKTSDAGMTVYIVLLMAAAGACMVLFGTKKRNA